MRLAIRTITSLLAAVAAVAAAASPAAEDGGWQPVFRRHAGEYHVSVAGAATAELVDEPILKWSQPIRGGDDGAVFLWTSGGRPVAVGTFFVWPVSEGRTGISHELVSLTTERLVAERAGRRWTPPAGSVTWQAVPEAPTPGATEAARELQLKNIARRFAARSTDRQGKPWELRLLAKPVHRYEAEDGGVSGALFAFAQGTDVEVVVRIERRGSGSQARWEFAPARLSDLPLALDYAKEEVWAAPAAAVDEPDGAYFLGTVEYRDEPPGRTDETSDSAGGDAQEAPTAASIPKSP